VKYLGLIWKNAWRKKIRTSLTILSVLVAFLLYSLLNEVGYAMTGGGATLASAKRLIVIDKISLINPLPISYLNKIAAMPGVAEVTHSSWFGGYYQDPKNQFAQFPIDPDSYFDVYTELEVDPEQLQAFRNNRTGMLVGRQVAELYGFKPGDRIPIQSTIWPQKDGNRTWEFDIEGTFATSDPRGSDAFVLFRYDYFDEARQFGQGVVGWYILNVADGANPVEIANAIDAEFANSPSETETSTEQAFAASFIEQFGNIALIVQLILGAVFFTLLLVTGNTMAQSVRERIAELAVLKTVGFGDRTVLGVVLAESVLIMTLGGLLGLGVGWVISQGLNKALAAYLGSNLFLSGQALVVAIAIMIGAGIAAGIFPAIQAMRLSIVDALARG
jgi:putative ABC transport system permease protein